MSSGTQLSRVHWRGQVVAAGILLGLAAVLLMAWRYVSGRGVSTPPAQVRLVGRTAEGMDWHFPESQGMPAVILYVSLTCSHCRAEVARWREVTAGHPDALRDIQLVVVVSASRPDLSWLPGELPFRGVWARRTWRASCQSSSTLPALPDEQHAS
jgi:hypothetical protein